MYTIVDSDFFFLQGDNGRRGNFTKVESLGAGRDVEEGQQVSKHGAATRIVTIGSVACPCGGTHVSSTQQLNGLRVTRVREKKGTVRVGYILESR